MTKDAQLAAFLAFADTLADAAARETLPRFRQEIDVANKHAVGEFDPVTAADEQAEAALRALITATYPAHGVLGEEAGLSPGTGPYTWVLDPVDGTRSFVAGLPLWTTLIALNDGTKPILGIIDQPYMGERFIGSAQGAFLKARGTTTRLTTRGHVRLADAVFSSTTPAMFETPAERAFHDAITGRCRLVRYGCDAYAYALLAAGRIDLVVEIGLKPWDVQAFMPLIEAAGGVVARFDEGPVQDGGSIIAAANSALLEECLDLLK